MMFVRAKEGGERRMAVKFVLRTEWIVGRKRGMRRHGVTVSFQLPGHCTHGETGGRRRVPGPPTVQQGQEPPTQYSLHPISFCGTRRKHVKAHL